MQHNIIMNCSFSYRKKFNYCFTRYQKKIFCVPIVRNIFLLILTVIITKRFNIHFSRITWLVATRSFLLGCELNFVNAPLLYFGRWAKSFLTATLFHNFQNIFQTLEWEQRKLVFTLFNLENVLSSLALENGTVNNNLINNSTSLKPLYFLMS